MPNFSQADKVKYLQVLQHWQQEIHAPREDARRKVYPQQSEKIIFDLYAGQNVRNALVRFEVVIHNVFICGYSVGDVFDPLNNSIETIRRT